MASTKSKKSRKGLAIGLAILGVAGLSLATASQLSLSSAGKFQSGAVAINADCQGLTTIPVGFSPVVLNTTTGIYSASNITFSGVKSTAAECGGLTYDVTIKTVQTPVYTAVTIATPTVPTTVGAGTTSVLTVPIPAGVVQSDITGVSLTIHS
jgi:hypothetical protein